MLRTYTFALLSAAFLSFDAASAQMGMAANVEVAVVEERTLVPTVEVPGTIISLENSAMAAEVEGPLLWSAEVGDRVAKGDPIARLDQRLLALAVQERTADVARIRADLKFREQDVVRFTELAATDNTSKARLDQVIAQRDMLEADLTLAQARLKRATGDLDRATLKAPFAGTVVERQANTGEYISVGETILRLVGTETVEISLPAPIAVTPFLNAGMTVQVLGDRGDRQHTIRAIVPVGDPVSRMVEVRLDASVQDYVIGSAVRVKLPSEVAVQSLAIPRDALVLRGTQQSVFKVGSDNKAEQIKIVNPRAVGLWIALDQPNGLRAGDQVIIRGAERLMPGQEVSVSAGS